MANFCDIHVHVDTFVQISSLSYAVVLQSSDTKYILHLLYVAYTASTARVDWYSTPKKENTNFYSRINVHVFSCHVVINIVLRLHWIRLHLCLLQKCRKIGLLTLIFLTLREESFPENLLKSLRKSLEVYKKVQVKMYYPLRKWEIWSQRDVQNEPNLADELMNNKFTDGKLKSMWNDLKHFHRKNIISWNRKNASILLWSVSTCM